MNTINNSHLQIALLIGSIATFIFVIYVIRRHKMSIKYAIIWIIWTLFILLLSIFPGIIMWLRNLLSVATPVNTVFLIVLFLIYIISFYAYLKISLQERKITDLNYHIGCLNKKVEDLEKTINSIKSDRK